MSPVFNVEILDATELPGIVGHKRKLERTGVRRNEEIVRADHRSTRFERSTEDKRSADEIIGYDEDGLPR